MAVEGKTSLHRIKHVRCGLYLTVVTVLFVATLKCRTRDLAEINFMSGKGSS
jgi:hypothetical protein